jgi:putative transposase
VPRKPRISLGGYHYHVFNRANARHQIFFDTQDYHMFLRVVKKGLTLFPIKIVSWCIMPNHWHFVVLPAEDGVLSKYFGWIANTHTQRFRKLNSSWGEGSLFCGRFKSQLISDHDSLPVVCRYVERNPVAANLVADARRWPWSSLGQDRCLNSFPLPIEELPERNKPGWIDWVNTPFLSKELEAIKSIEKFGNQSDFSHLQEGG